MNFLTVQHSLLGASPFTVHLNRSTGLSLSLDLSLSIFQFITLCAVIAFASGYKAISWHNRWDDEGGMGGGMEGGMGGGMMGGGGGGEEMMMGGWVSKELPFGKWSCKWC